jgi:hypothetical protein
VNLRKGNSMRQLTASQKIAQLEHRIAHLEKQALIGIFKSNMRRAKEIHKAIHQDISKGYEQWLIDQILPFQLGRKLGNDYEFEYEDAPDNKYEWAVDPYHESDERSVKSLSANKFMVDMWLGGDKGLDLTIVFDERGLGSKIRGKDPSFTVYMDGEKAFHLKNIRDIKNGLAWKNALKALKTEFRELGREIEDYTRDFLEAHEGEHL